MSVLESVKKRLGSRAIPRWKFALGSLGLLAGVTGLGLLCGAVFGIGEAAKAIAAFAVVAAVLLTGWRDMDILGRTGWRTKYAMVVGVIAEFIILFGPVSRVVYGDQWDVVAAQLAVGWYWVFFLLTLPVFITGAIKKGKVGSVPATNGPA